ALPISFRRLDAQRLDRAPRRGFRGPRGRRVHAYTRRGLGDRNGDRRTPRAPRRRPPRRGTLGGFDPLPEGISGVLAELGTRLVGRQGLEPWTLGLKVRCSTN